MAVSDPITVTISGSAIPLARISTGANQSLYQSGDSLVAMKIASTYGKTRYNRVVSLEQTKISPDPFRPAENQRNSFKVNVTTNEPTTGFTIAERVAVIDAIVAALQASTKLLMTKWQGGEN